MLLTSWYCPVSAWSDGPSKDFPSSPPKKPVGKAKTTWPRARLESRAAASERHDSICAGSGTWNKKICGAANYGFQMSPPPSDTAFQRFTSSLPGCSLLFRLFLRGRRSYAAWATVYRSNNARQGCQADGQPPVGKKKPEPPGCFVGGCMPMWVRDPCAPHLHPPYYNSLRERPPASRMVLCVFLIPFCFCKASPWPICWLLRLSHLTPL